MSSIHTKEQKIAIYKITQLMNFWKISAKEIGEIPKKASNEKTERSGKPPIKYRHPILGLTWDGEGSQPEWLRTAILKEGYLVDELKAAVNQRPSMENHRSASI